MAETTQNYDLFNFQQNKNIAVVVCIQGLDFCLANRAVYSKIKYGDPGLVYGLPGLVYGGLRKVDTIYDLLSLDSSSLTLQQIVEPEQGRASISTMSMSFIDRDGLMTQIISPGVLLDDILGKEVTVELGYQEISYPQDYFVIFRGIVTSVKSAAGMVTLQFSDANTKKRQNIFFPGVTKLTGNILAGDVNLPVVTTGDFAQRILGPDGGYDSAIKLFVKIEDEYIEYTAATVTPTQFTGVTRGARGTVAAAHTLNSEVLGFIEIEDHAIDMALKIMLSGFNGAYVVDQPLSAFVGTSVGSIPNAIEFPEGVDVERDYGITVGDYVYTSGASIPANNFSGRRVVSIQDAGELNPKRIITVDGAALVSEAATAAVISFRSKYDVYPVSAGVKMKPSDVDVEGHELLKAQFLSGNENSYRFFIGAEEAGKTFIEREIWLPLGCYSLTRNGRVSVKITKPPLAGDQLIELNRDNILNAQNLRPERATNSRTFYNDIVFTTDFTDEGEATSQFRIIDTDSLNIIGLNSTLKIQSKGTRGDLTGNLNQVVARRARFLLSRYKNAAIVINVDVNWATGNQIEAGDVVALNGNGLSIANFLTGDREFGTQLFEVVDRKLNLSTGVTSLKMISGVGADATDRFATISPSSVLGSGSTATDLKIVDSFSSDDPKYPGEEFRKWEQYLGLPVAVHNEDYSYYEETTLIEIDPVDPSILRVTALSGPPPAGYIVDIARYPTDTDPLTNILYKQRHAYINPTVAVTSGASSTQFDVAPGDAGKFFVGSVVRVHNAGFSIDSDDVKVTNVSGTTITTEDLGFTPAAGQLVELIGFADGGGAYRWV